LTIKIPLAMIRTNYGDYTANRVLRLHNRGEMNRLIDVLQILRDKK